VAGTLISMNSNWHNEAAVSDTHVILLAVPFNSYFQH